MLYLRNLNMLAPLLDYLAVVAIGILLIDKPSPRLFELETGLYTFFNEIQWPPHANSSRTVYENDLLSSRTEFAIRNNRALGQHTPKQRYLLHGKKTFAILKC